MNNSRYVVISPSRNEEEFLPGTIGCMERQTVKPCQWILIDDGSTDGSLELMVAASRRHEWITILQRKDRGFRLAGTGVIDAFYDGYECVAHPDWDYLVKFDADLSFAQDYFEQCLRRFYADPKLGIAGGTICNEIKGRLEVESKVDPRFHVRGATKIYRRQCWDAIGGLIRAPGWDTVDEVKANMLGWTTYTFPDLKLLHHRMAGGAYGQWNNWIKGGRANYIAGYHPLFMLLKCIRRLFNKPYFIGGAGLWFGFLGCYLRRAPQIPDTAVIKYFQRQQINRLLGRRSLWS